MQIYDRKRPYVNRQILIDIKNLQESRTLESIKKFIDDLFGGKFLCAMLSRGHSETSEAFSPYLLANEDGEYVFPIFTNELEILKGQNDFDNYTVYSLEFEDILNILNVLSKQIPVAIAIDPYGTNFYLTEAMIRVAMVAKNGSEK